MRASTPGSRRAATAASSGTEDAPVAPRRQDRRFHKAEVDAGRVAVEADADPGRMLSRQELHALKVGFRTIRDDEQLDDVTDWANAVLALLQDEPA